MCVQQVLQILQKTKEYEMQYIKTELISSKTHATFDAFAAKIMEHQLVELLNPAQGMTFDDLTARVLNDWREHGLITAPICGQYNAMDVARACVGFVLKYRGFNLCAIKSVLKAMDAPMYRDISMLQFAVLACRGENLPTAGTPLLVIDGDNRVGVCLAWDLPAIVGDEDVRTYSHTVLNMGRILNDEMVPKKVIHFGVEDFLELPRKIARRLCQSGIKKVNIEPAKNRIYTETDGGEDPLFGERVIKYQNGRIVSEVVKETEVLRD